MLSAIIGIITGITLIIALLVNTIKTLDSKHEKFLADLGWGRIIIGFTLIWFIFKVIVEPPLENYLTTIFLIKLNLVAACGMFALNKASINRCIRLSKKKNKD